MRLEEILKTTPDELVQAYLEAKMSPGYAEECTGYPAVDINRPYDSNAGSVVIFRCATTACKITPTSRCLDFITILRIKRYASANMWVEIREDDNNKPKGKPGESTGRLAEVMVPYSEIPTDFGEVHVEFGLVLPTANKPYWIVVRPSDYYCSLAYCSGYERYHIQNANVADQSRDIGPPDCVWETEIWPSWALVTYKKTYSPPCVNPACDLVVT